jgi:hypothetical protein
MKGSAKRGTSTCTENVEKKIIVWTGLLQDPLVVSTEKLTNFFNDR